MKRTIKGSRVLVPKPGHFRVELRNGYVIWDVNENCKKAVKPVADQFGISVEEFLKRKTLGRLPGQITCRRKAHDAPRGFGVTPCNDRQLWTRIERAAAFGARYRGVPSKDKTQAFVWDSIMGWVDACEDDMILHPLTGRPIGDELEIERFRVAFELRPVR